MSKDRHIHATNDLLEAEINKKYVALSDAAADLAQAFSKDANQITLDGVKPLKLKALMEDAMYQGAIPKVLASPHINGAAIKAAELLGMNRSTLRRITVRLFPKTQEAA